MNSPGAAALLSLTTQPGQSPTVVEAGYGAALDTDATLFAARLEQASLAHTSIDAPGTVAKALFEPLDSINTEAQALVDYAEAAMRSGNELTPSEIVSLTARSQEFMFHAQLTANVANRTADGLQQLFRQQS